MMPTPGRPATTITPHRAAALDRCARAEAELAAAEAARTAAIEARRQAVWSARKAGLPWRVISGALGVSGTRSEAIARKRTPAGRR